MPPYDPNTTDDSRRPRRRRRPRERIGFQSECCAREGCHAYRTKRTSYCSGLCWAVDRERQQVERIVAVLGESPRVSELRASVEALNSARSQQLSLSHAVYQAALSVGITHGQWHAICNGTRAA